VAVRVHIQSDAIVSGTSYNATQQVGKDGRKEAKDSKKGAHLRQLFLQTVGFFKSEFSSKVRRPIVSTAKWAWNLYLRIVVVLAKGVRTITWPISHLL